MVRRGAKSNLMEGVSRNTIKTYLVQDGTDQAVESINKIVPTLPGEPAKTKVSIKGEVEGDKPMVDT